ncbi:erythromycin esterase family protein [Pedobacter sp. KR3-3]|uniref:Erythromycin esterase family protein n=1 Tax=Pedobacter albus TaxID=3113905 RepID=A0ABU7I4A6_9SPHI|nr:erythromycin esterase family protein [Pedobacter sp. KR3-3]MEE1944156.1 erythromycin esterase family protein [Pedobacter sp. KR3-3]
MPLNKISISVLICVLFFISLNSSAQEKSEKIISSLNELVNPIKTLNADSSFEDLLFLKEPLKEKEVIALGEVTHGTREVFDYKDRLVRFLVISLAYKAIAFESDFIALEKIDDYINGKIAVLGNLSGTPLHLNNVKMIEWLKKYNLSQSDENKVHVYGLEARGFNNISAKILEQFTDLDINDKKTLEKFKATSYTDLKKDDINLIKKTIENLRKVNASAMQQHYVNLLAQNVDYFHEKKIGLRDEYMSKNATWIKEKTSNNKLIVWAHNGHVAKTALYNEPSMGTFLFEKYKSKYFVIATDFNYGEVLVRKYIAKNKPIGDFSPLYYPEVTSDKAYEYYFKQCKYKNFIIDINSSIKNPILNTFFNQAQDMRMIGATSTPVNKKLSIGANFDLIVYFDKSTSS